MSQPLFAEFKPISPQDWEAQIAADLKGQTAQSLASSAGGLDIKPFYTQADATGEPIVNTPGWIVSEEIDATDGKLGNQASQVAIANGATGLRLKVNRTTNIHALLDGLPLDMVQIDFLIDRQCWNVLDDIRLIPAAYDITGAIDYDLVAVDRENDTPQLFDEYATLLPNYRLITLHENTDTPPAKALANLLARGNRYIKDLLAVGYTIDTIAAKMQFSCLVGTDYFVEIAKLRALRSLWTIMLQEYGGTAESIFIHADNLPLQPTPEKDAYYNMIRHTTQAMAAIIGGANSICITPAADDTKGEFFQRIARNAQLVLKHEAKLDKVADPGAGAWYLEALTEQLAEKAWGLFLKE